LAVLTVMVDVADVPGETAAGALADSENVPVEEVLDVTVTVAVPVAAE
jgi:hypothetical protein